VRIIIIEFIIRAIRIAYVKNIIMITDRQVAENVILAVVLALEQPKMTVDPVLFQVIELIIPITIVVSVIQDSLNQE
jgi:hypothetical protein